LRAAARHPRFSLKNAGEIIRRIGFLAGLASARVKIAINSQKSSKNLKKMLSASKIFQFFVRHGSENRKG